jgi:predicted Holliday junction resolvase-like endonuclease
MNKIILFIIVLLFTANIVHAQPVGNKGNRQEKIEAILVAFVTKHLDLTVDEAQQFWPVYNKYNEEYKNAVKNNRTDEIKKNEAILTVQKKYKPNFLKILKTEERTNKVFLINKKIKDLIERRKNNNSNRPGGGNGQKIPVD